MKRFCKLNRRDITAEFNTIQSLVQAPQFICQGCARSSSDKKNLCKPKAFNNAANLQQVSELFDEKQIPSELILKDSAVEPLVENTPNDEQFNAEASLGVVEVVAEASAKPSLTDELSLESDGINFSSVLDKKSYKRAKKALKAKHKQIKQLKKQLKRQAKLSKKQQKLEKKYLKLMETHQSQTASHELH